MEAIAETAPRDRPGRVLAVERERQGLAPADIAQRLHMSVSQIEALERDDYAPLPRGPFLRGFVRNYAKALGLAPEGVLSLLAEGAPREPAPRIVVPSQNIRFDADRIASPYVRAAAIATVAIVLGFAAMYWWLFIRNAPMAASHKAAPAAVAQMPVPAPAPAPVPAPVLSQPVVEPAKAEPSNIAPKVVETVAKAEPARSAPPRSEPQPAIQRVSAVGSGGSLRFQFRGKSWVEIRDAGGKVLLTGVNDPGSQAEVVGKPPFRVIVGNAPEVRMFFNDREFDLAPHMREAVARLTVE